MPPVLDGLPDDPPESERVGVPVAELGARRDAVGLPRSVLEDVERVEIDAHVLVLGDQGGRSVESQVRHVEPAAHGEEVPHQDDAARIALRAPLGDRRRVVEPEVPLLHEHPDQGRGDALALRPTDLRCVPGEAGCVALADDLPVPDHREGPGVLLLGAHGGIERRVERRPVHAGLIGFFRADVPKRPVLLVRRGLVPGHRDRRETHRIGAVLQQGAPLVPVVLRGTRGHIGRPHGGALRLHVHFPLEVVLPGETDERRDVLGEHRLRRPLGDPSDDEGAGTEMVRRDPGGVFPEAAVIRLFRWFASASAGGEDRERDPGSKKPTPVPSFLHRAFLPLESHSTGTGFRRLGYDANLRDCETPMTSRWSRSSGWSLTGGSLGSSVRVSRSRAMPAPTGRTGQRSAVQAVPEFLVGQ